MQKKVIFLAKHLVFFGLAPSHLATLQYLRTPPVTSLAFGTIPPKLRSQNAPHAPYFPLKKHFFCKKMHFFRKIFGHVHFLLYLCTAFPPTWFKGVAKSTTDRLFSSVGQSTWFVISGSLVRIRQEAQEKLNFEIEIGSIPERPNGADCKSAGFHLRWFESICSHKKK